MIEPSKSDEKLEKLLDDITKDLFIWRMARSLADRDDKTGRSAMRRRLNALDRIRNRIIEYSE